MRSSLENCNKNCESNNGSCNARPTPMQRINGKAQEALGLPFLEPVKIFRGRISHG